MKHDEAVLFLQMLRGSMVAFASHLDKVSGRIQKEAHAEDIDPTANLQVDFLELFYAACDREKLRPETRKEFKVLVLEVLGMV